MNKVIVQSLKIVGSRGTYQKLLGVYLFILANQVHFFVFGSTFIYMNPLFKCTFTQDLVDESIACSQLPQCQITSPYTIVSKLQLYCDRQIYRSFIQASLSIGSVVGLLSIPFLSDKRGRKSGLVFGLGVGVAGTVVAVVAGYGQSVVGLMVSQFLLGFSAFQLIIPSFVLPTQYCDDKFRQNIIVVINYSWPTATIIIGLLYFYYNYWMSYLLIFVLAPTVILLFITIFFFVQSPYFLYNKSPQKYLQSLQKISKYNKTSITAQQIQSLQSLHQPPGTSHQPHQPHQSSQTPKQPPKQLITRTIRHPYYLKLLIILILVKTGNNINYTGYNYALDQVGLGYGENCVLAGVVELVSYVVLQFFVTRLPRRGGLIVGYGLLAAFGFLFLIPFIQDNTLPKLTVLAITRFLSTIVFTILLLYLTESFPKRVQATFIGIIEAVSQAGTFSAPIIMAQCIKHQLNAIVVISIPCVLFVVLPLLVVREGDRPGDWELMGEGVDGVGVGEGEGLGDGLMKGSGSLILNDQYGRDQ